MFNNNDDDDDGDDDDDDDDDENNNNNSNNNSANFDERVWLQVGRGAQGSREQGQDRQMRCERGGRNTYHRK
eukprot:675618-Pyramimonas_sp.AAC.1